MQGIRVVVNTVEEEAEVARRTRSHTPKVGPRTVQQNNNQPQEEQTDVQDDMLAAL